MPKKSKENIIRKSSIRRPKLDLKSSQADEQLAAEEIKTEDKSPTKELTREADKHEHEVLLQQEPKEKSKEQKSQSPENSSSGEKVSSQLRPQRIGIRSTKLIEKDEKALDNEKKIEDKEEIEAEYDKDLPETAAAKDDSLIDKTNKNKEDLSYSPKIEFAIKPKRIKAAKPQLGRLIAAQKELSKEENKSKKEQKYDAKKTWQKPAIADIPLRFNSFSQALDSCRELHKLPEEMLMEQTAVQRTWLLSQVKRAKSEDEIQALAYSLNYKDLSTLFPTLATLKKREEIDQIQNLIRLRASHYLYICGWLTFQFSYPRTSVARVLADLCMILEDIYFLEEGNAGREMLPSSEAKLPQLGAERILWNEVVMISEIALPNSRHFVRDIATELYRSNIDTNLFFKRYAIYPNLSLGKAILEKYDDIASGMNANPLLSNAFLERFRSNL